MAGLSRHARTRTKCRKILPVWCLIVLACVRPLAARTQEPLTGQQPPRQAPTLRVAVNRVDVGVTVTDSRGRFISGLRRGDFRIFDNNVEQPITDFLSVAEPAQVLLMIEAGPAVLLFAKNHVLAANQMVTSLAPDDQIGIATYTQGPQDVIGFTKDKAAARLALRSINFMQGYGELNMFSSISRAVDVLSVFPGKKSIVLLSTGVDTSPNVNWDSLRDKLRTADVRVVAVSLSGEMRKPIKRKRLSPDEKEDWRWLKTQIAEGDQALRELSQATGGRAYFVKKSEDFPKTYAAIADMLRHEYSLAFAPTVFDGKVHTLRVEVKKRGAQVDHRPAYLPANGNGVKQEAPQN